MIVAEFPRKGATYPLPSGGTVEITDETYVAMGDGFTFACLTYRNDNITVTFEVRNGVPGAASITLTAGDKLLRTKDLTAIKLDQIRLEVCAVAGVGAFVPYVVAGVDPADFDVDDYGQTEIELSHAVARKAINRATSRRKITPEFLSRVAEIYQGAPEGGRIEAVKAAFSARERQAWRYVAQAREKGLIDGNH
jgi:predicted lipoprotein